ncbi:MAG TPA: hypothetical protein VFT26_10170, partial [Pyrinomonadaceae bacterium]|nr:hypothetical protein [Pyrinomonadaceae bacterium]
RDEEFVAARLDTGFIARFNERRAATEVQLRQVESDLAAIAAGLSYTLRKQQASVPATTHTNNRWKMAGRNAGLRKQTPITSSKWRKS